MPRMWLKIIENNYRNMYPYLAMNVIEFLENGGYRFLAK